jgi:hypothetical protein
MRSDKQSRSITIAVPKERVGPGVLVYLLNQATFHVRVLTAQSRSPARVSAQSASVCRRLSCPAQSGQPSEGTASLRAGIRPRGHLCAVVASATVVQPCCHVPNTRSVLCKESLPRPRPPRNLPPALLVVSSLARHSRWSRLDQTPHGSVRAAACPAARRSASQRAVRPTHSFEDRGAHATPFSPSCLMCVGAETSGGVPGGAVLVRGGSRGRGHRWRCLCAGRCRGRGAGPRLLVGSAGSRPRAGANGGSACGLWPGGFG